MRRRFVPCVSCPALEPRVPLDGDPVAAPAEVYDPDAGGGGDFMPDPAPTPMDPVLLGWVDPSPSDEWSGGTGGLTEWLDPGAGQTAADEAGMTDPAAAR